MFTQFEPLAGEFNFFFIRKLTYDNFALKVRFVHLGRLVDPDAVFFKVLEHVDGFTDFAGSAELDRALADGFNKGKPFFLNPLFYGSGQLPGMECGPPCDIRRSGGCDHLRDVERVFHGSVRAGDGGQAPGGGGCRGVRPRPPPNREIKQIGEYQSITKSYERALRFDSQ